MKEIRRAPTAPQLCGEVDGQLWARSDIFEINQFAWDTGLVRQATTMRALFDDKALYLQYQCEDRQITSVATELNGPVFKDSCVELFAQVRPESDDNYFNLEMNACGHMLMQLGTQGPGRRFVDAPGAVGIRIVTSVPGPTRQPSPQDKQWWLAAMIPWDVLSKFIGYDARPHNGTVWRINAFRCGGGSEFATWSLSKHPLPSFHMSQYFGEVVFVDAM